MLCVAKDAAGNEAEDKFPIEVRKGQEGEAERMIDGLLPALRAMDLPEGIQQSLNAKLTRVQATLSTAKGGARVSACNQLSAFMHQVQAQRGKALTEGQAKELLAGAGEIQQALGCS